MDNMAIGVSLPPELEQATKTMIGAAIQQVVDDTKKANHWPAYMNQRQAAAYLGVSAGTIIRWEKASIDFPTIYIEGSKHYSKTALDEWMATQQHKH